MFMLSSRTVIGVISSIFFCPGKCLFCVFDYNKRLVEEMLFWESKWLCAGLVIKNKRPDSV